MAEMPAPESGQGLEAYLRDWVERSGRALELRVARAGRAVPADLVEQSFLYRDQEGGVTREGDVAATFVWGDGQRARLGQLVLVMECKSGSEDGKRSAWVGFLDQSRQPLRDTTRAYAVGSGPPDAHGVARAPELDWELAGAVTPLVCSHLVLASQNRGDRNPANDAVRQASSAAAGYRPTEHAEWFVTIAAVVISDELPLYTCQLDRVGAVEFERVPGLRVRADGHLVWVVTESELPRLLDHVQSLAMRAGKRARFARETGSGTP